MNEGTVFIFVSATSGEPLENSFTPPPPPISIQLLLTFSNTAQYTDLETTKQQTTMDTYMQSGIKWPNIKK